MYILLHLYLIVFISFILFKSFYYSHTSDFIFIDYRIYRHLIPLFPPIFLLTPLYTLLTVPLLINLLVHTIIFLYLLLYTYFSISIPLYLLLYIYYSMLTLLCLLFYAYYSIYVTDFTFFNYIGTTYMYISCFVYVVNHVFFNYIIIISTFLFTLSIISSSITYSLHLLFRLYCQLFSF